MYLDIVITHRVSNYFITFVNILKSTIIHAVYERFVKIHREIAKKLLNNYFSYLHNYCMV